MSIKDGSLALKEGQILIQEGKYLSKGLQISLDGQTSQKIEADGLAGAKMNLQNYRFIVAHSSSVSKLLAGLVQKVHQHLIFILGFRSVSSPVITRFLKFYFWN